VTDVTFEEILPAVNAGGRARRRLWAELDGRIGDWLELVTDGMAGGRPMRPVYMIWNGRAGMLGMWGGAHQDMQPDVDDWELL
jgi:hypothetical protein